ncbi:MAG TPA: Eco57I restriction-modification methylase domain-containing protein, partial [Niabella sp.]|nr:Eco57I restriction-modification methylase domain-containing protein [Niabella sp.]
NPPYVKVSDKKIFDYFNNKFVHQDYQQDLYLLFLEQYKMLLATGGKLGVIIPNTWLQSIKFRNIRNYLINNYSWDKLMHIKDKVFKAVVDTHVLIFEKNDYIKNNALEIDILNKGEINPLHTISQYDLPDNGDIINILANEEEKNLFEKIKNQSVQISEIAKSYSGITLYEKRKGNPPQTAETMKLKPFESDDFQKPKGKNWLPLMRGSL